VTHLRFAQISFVFALLVAGCAPEDGEDLIDIATLDGMDEVKDDTAGGRYVKVMGTIRYGESLTMTAGGGPTYRGYRFTAAAGDSIRARAIGNGILLFSLYGPQKSDGSWGPVVMKRWFTYQKDAILTHEVTRGGKYLLVAGVTGSTFVRLCDRDGACALTCEEHGHSTDTAQSGNFYASNVSSDDEGRFRANYESPVHIVIRDGACGEQSETCEKTRKTVCGQIRNTTQNYFNLCELQVAVRNALADEWGERAGWWRLGACP
jgi:hypothetical protein